MNNKAELQKKFNRDLIVDTAERLFLESGYEKTTMDEIAKAAGYSKATVYVYLKSKEEILNYIILKGMKGLKSYAERAVNSGKDLENRYYDLCFAFADYQNDYPFHFESLLGNISIEFENDENDVLFQIYKSGEELNEVTGRFISDGMKAGFFRSDLNLFETIFTFWASLSGMVKMASQKAAYFEMSTGKTKKEFLHNCFTILLMSIKNR